MRSLLLAMVVAASACAPPSGPSSPGMMPAPLAEEPVVRHEASLPLCRGEPYESPRRIRPDMFCYPVKHLIQQAIRDQHEAFRACYEQVLKRDREARGSILARFTIGDDGSVPQLCIEDSEIDDRYFVECVADAFVEATFPPTHPDSTCPGQVVAYPLLFRPVGEG